MENLSLEKHFFYEAKLLADLEEKSWCHLPHFLSPQIIDQLDQAMAQKGRLSAAQIGGGLQRELNKGIRDCESCWVENWEEEPFSFLYQENTYIQELLRNHFLLALKRFETQYAHYPVGGFYKKHLDQIAGKGHRQVTMVLFLNDVFDGGELVIYNKDDKGLIDAKISPKKGATVIFFSSQVYHEVLSTNEERLTLTTWLRDDEVEPWVL